MAKSLQLVVSLLVSLMMGHMAYGQTSINWQDLADVHFTSHGKKDPVYGLPNFGPTVEALEGQTVVIDGYMLPLTVDNTLYILSKYPFTECFFCGGAGKETVVELKLSEQLKFNVDEPVTIQGKLKLIEDPLQISYVLEEATRIE